MQVFLTQILNGLQLSMLVYLLAAGLTLIFGLMNILNAAITVTKRPAGALKLTKKLMRDHERIAAQISEESELFKERLKTPEAREAFAAFAERRPPDFSRVA